MNKILIVEDDEKIREELGLFLTNHGYQVQVIGHFENVLEQMQKSNVDLVLLDIQLPGQDGTYLCREFRKNSSIPIIMVTSKNTELDELLSLNYGADDFISKPYHPQILLAHIEAILKRTQHAGTKLSYEHLILNLSKSTLESTEKVVELSKNEFKIMDFLLRHRGTIVTRESLMSYLWESEMFVDDNTLNVNITRLRRKLEEFGLEECLETRRGQGYILL